MEDRSHRVWIGTGGGVLVYANASNGIRQIGHYPGNNVQSPLRASYNALTRHVAISVASVRHSPIESRIFRFKRFPDLDLPAFLNRR